MKLSIIIPVYNVEQYIGRCLQSCLSQANVTAEDYILAIQLDEIVGDGMQYILDMDRGVELFPENPYLVSISAYMHTKIGAYNSAIKLLRWALKYSENK